MLLRRFATSLFIGFSGAAVAAPVQWSVNGHFYEVVSAPATISWEDADAAAVAAGGYLATITSAPENDLVFALVNQPTFWHGSSGPWLGGYQSPATQQPDANWCWVTGEAWTYTNWQTAQPNDSGGKAEDKLQFGFAPRVSVWNDIMSLDPTPAYRPIAYVVEWNTDPFPPSLEARWLASPSQIELCWQTTAGRSYQLLYCTNLTTGHWAPLNMEWVRGDGARHCELDTISSTNLAGFYRLLSTTVPPRPPK